MNFKLLLCFFTSLVTANLPDVIKIGGLFDAGSSEEESTFRFAVKRVNSMHKIEYGTSLSAHAVDVKPNDSFDASKKVCYLLRAGVTAIFGPQSPQTSRHIMSICDTMGIPYIETRLDFLIGSGYHSVNLYPHPTSLSKAYSDFVQHSGWKNFTIVYEDNNGLLRLQEVLKSQSCRSCRITVRQLNQTDDYRLMLQEIMLSGDKNIVLDCATENIYTFLQQALQIGMSNDYNYLITSLDLHMVDLVDYKYGDNTINAFQLVNSTSPEVENLITNWWSHEMLSGQYLKTSEGKLKTETVLLYDAVHLLAYGLHELDKVQDIHIQTLNCDREDYFLYGSSLVNCMKQVEFKGLSGIIKFDNQGLRTDFNLDIMGLNESGLIKVGTWSIYNGINFFHSRDTDQDDYVLEGRTLIVTTILSFSGWFNKTPTQMSRPMTHK